MKKMLLAAVAFAVLVSSASAQVALTATKDFEEQGWKKSGGQEITRSEDAIIIDDRSEEDTATLAHPIAPELANELAKSGFELSLSLRARDASPSGMGIEVHVAKGVRFTMGFSTWRNKQTINFYDATTKKHLGHQIKTDDFVNYRVVWKPDPEGGKVTVFANDKEVISKAHAAGPRKWPSRVLIGGMGAGKPRLGKLEIKGLELKALAGDEPASAKARPAEGNK
jgi:hypothetical protein